MNIQPTMPAIVTGGNGNGFGDGFGGGGLLALALLAGRGGFGFGNDGFRGNNWGGGDGCVSNSTFTAGITGVTDAIQNTTVVEGIGDIKQAIFQAEGNLQLAGCENTSAIRSHLGQVENTIVAGQLNLANGINGVNVNVLQSAAATREAVASSGTQNLLATKDAQAVLSAQAASNTNLILAALKDQEITNLSRQLTVAELRNTEDRAEARARTTEVNVTQTVNQNQAQLQAQQQQQQQLQILANLNACVGNLANDIQVVRATQQNINFGTQAGVGQTSNATNNSVR